MAIATTTQPIQTDFGNIAARGVQQVQQAQQLEEQKKEREYQKMLDLEDRYGIPEEDFSLPDTEFRTFNDITTEVTSQARDRYYDVFKKLQKDPQNTDLKKQLGRIKGSVGQIRATHEKFMALGEDYLAKLEADKISGVDEDDLMEKLQAVEEGRYKLRFDDNDRLQVLTYDSQGKLSDTLSYKELINRNAIEKVEVDETLDKFMERIGEDNLTVAENGRLVTSNVFGARQEQAAINQINSLVGTNEASLKKNDAMADLLYQATNGATKKRENFTEQERTQVKDWLLENVRGRYDTKTTMAGDPVWMQKQANARAFQQQQQSQQKGAVQFTAAADSDGQPLIDRNNNVEFSVSRKTSSGAYEPIQIKTDNSDIFINTIKRDYNGRLTVEGNQRVKLAGTYQDKESAREEAENQYDGGDLLRVMEDNSKTGSYYAVVKYEDSDETLINSVANQTQAGDYTKLRDILDGVFMQRFNNNYDPFISMPVPNSTGGTQSQEQPFDDLQPEGKNPVDEYGATRSNFIGGHARQGAAMGFNVDEIVKDIKESGRVKGELTQRELDYIKKYVKKNNPTDQDGGVKLDAFGNKIQ